MKTQNQKYLFKDSQQVYELHTNKNRVVFGKEIKVSFMHSCPVKVKNFFS